MARKKASAATESQSIPKAIRMCVDSGKTLIGKRDTMKMALLGRGKLIVIASNMPGSDKADMQHHCTLSGLPVLEFDGTSVELGAVCGKPFSISALWIGETGNSPIMALIAKK